MSISGTISILLSNGAKTYVSRPVRRQDQNFFATVSSAQLHVKKTVFTYTARMYPRCRLRSWLHDADSGDSRGGRSRSIPDAGSKQILFAE